MLVGCSALLNFSLRDWQGCSWGGEERLCFHFGRDFKKAISKGVVREAEPGLLLHMGDYCTGGVGGNTR